MSNDLRRLEKDLRAYAKRNKDVKYSKALLMTFLITGTVSLTAWGAMASADYNDYRPRYTISMADTSQKYGAVSGLEKDLAGSVQHTASPVLVADSTPNTAGQASRLGNVALASNTAGAASTKEIEGMKKSIDSSITTMKSDFKTFKAENDKLLKASKMELIKLMEQGDHVVKSPWSSWQFGMNTLYNDWRGNYKGRGDKIEDVIYQRDTTMAKYKYDSNPGVLYGNTTSLVRPIEPNAAIPVSASLTPITPKVKQANLALNVDLSSLPSFVPRTVQEPVEPTVKAPNPQINIALSITSGSRGTGNQVVAFHTGQSAFDNVAIKGGKLELDNNNGSYNYTAANVNTAQIVGGNVASSIPGFAYGTPQTGTYTTNISNAFIQVAGWSNGSNGITLNSSDVDYKVSSYNSATHFAELVHQDVHGGMPGATVDNALTTALITGVTPAVFSEIYKTNSMPTSGSKVDNYNVFANAGTINIEGQKAIFTHSYNHGGENSIIMNSGNVNLNKSAYDNDNPITSQHAVFLVSRDSNNSNATNQQHYYNSGTITANTDNTAMFLFVPTAKRRISVENKNSMILNGNNSVGLFANNSNTGVNLHLNFSTATNAGTQTQITAHTESLNNNSYMNTLTGGIIDKATARTDSKPIIVKGKTSAGLYMPNLNTFVNGQFAVDVQTTAADATEGSAGIYSASDIDLQGHYVKVGGDYNVGVYPTDSSTEIYLGKGSVEINGGSNNTGIVVKNGKGRVFSESEIVLEGGVSNTAVYAQGHTGNGNDVEVKSIETDTTAQKDSVVIYAAGGAKIKTDDTTGGLKIKGEISSGSPVYDSATSTIDKTAGGAYANGGSTIDISQTGLNFGNTGAADYNIDITGAKAVDLSGNPTDVYTGFGVFATGGSTIKADYNKIKATDTGAGVASTGANSNVIVDNGEVNYSGSGYALFSDGVGKISLQNGKLVLGGNATGYSVSMGSAPSVDLTGSTVDIQSNDVILMNLKNATSLQSSGLAATLLGATGLVPTAVSSSNGSNNYKYAVIDGGHIDINTAVDKADTTNGSDSYTFTRRILLQNSTIDVNAGQTVSANLDSTELASIDTALTVPVGLAVSASANSLSTATTGITNNGTVEADRTDAGNGAVGIYVNYGKLTNSASGIVNVETGTGATPNSANDKAVGVYGTNSTPIVNDGAITVGGKTSFGILGLSYRLDSNGAVVDPSTESFYNAANSAAGEYGKVDITNTGTITMNDDSALGIYALNNSLNAVNAADRKTNAEVKAVNSATGVITINGSNNAIGMGANRGTLTNNGTINVNGTVSAGMYGTNSSVINNAGTVNVIATAPGSESIGLYTDDANTPINTSGKINVGNSSYGIYGKNVNMTAGEINVGDDGVGVYSTGPNVNLTGKMSVGSNNAVGVYIADDKTAPQATTVSGNVNMTIGDTDTFGYLITAVKDKTDLTTAAGTTASVGEKSVYIYSAAPKSLGGKIVNNTDITATKNNGYAIYSAQDADNFGAIDLKSSGGNGNIGIYSTGGLARNYGVIEVGKTNASNEEYGIGMATGYYDKATGTITNEGTIENHNIINVTEDNSVGMYAVGSNSKAVNRGTINLSGNNASGMYIDQGATGINYGIIQTTSASNGKGIKGVVVINNGILKNYGTINISGADNMGVYKDGTGQTSSNAEDVEAGTGLRGTNNSTVPVFVGTPTDQKLTGKVVIKTPPASAPKSVAVSINGVDLTPTHIDTNISDPKATEVLITDATGATTLNLAMAQMDNHKSNGEISTIGMYVDTSGINYTNPISGLHNLQGLSNIDLIIGTEAAKYTNAKVIQIGDNILKPYNDALGKVVTTGVTLNINSSSLTWLAQPVQSTSIASPIQTVYMVKIPYTDFASVEDKDTANFLDGLEQRYGVEGIDSREKQVFNKLNDLGKGESHIFTQAVNEMKGYQYSNTQHRVHATGELLDKEFRHLHKDWRNPSKQNNKIKAFGMRDEYNTDTAGIIDYSSRAYGVAYVHEDETVKLGNSSGWYAGVVNNHFKFKDIGKSRENQTMLKLGLFKTTSPAKDHNGAFQWTIAGDVFAGINEMKRRFWIVDDVFSAKSNYSTYGAALKNEIGYDARLSERIHLKPYGLLKVEYGRFSDIKEKDGEIRLEVDGNDYISVKPEIGLELKYVQPLAMRTNLSIGLTAAYENELGKLNKLNQARVAHTTADWYNLRNEKEDRRGSGKFDLNIGVDNTRFGVTVNAGYDTRGENVRGGIGFRAIY